MITCLICQAELDTKRGSVLHLLDVPVGCCTECQPELSGHLRDFLRRLDRECWVMRREPAAAMADPAALSSTVTLGPVS